MAFGGKLKSGIVGGMVAGPAGAIAGASGILDKGVNAIGKSLGGAFGGTFGGAKKADTYSYDEDAFKNKEMSDALRKKLGKYEKDADATARAKYINTRAGAGMADKQKLLADQLYKQTLGEGPSLAQDQLNRATDQNIAQSMAMAASQRGRSAGAGLRQVAQQTQAAQQAASRDSASMRMQEQLAAQQGLAGVSQAARGQDLSQAAQIADTKLRQAQMVNQMKQFGFQQQAGLNQADLARQMELEKLKGGMTLGVQGINQQERAAKSAATAGIIGGVAGGVGAAFSDEEKKKNINGYPQDKVKSFIDALKGYEYEYKNPKEPMAGEGTHVSPMAQDMEKTELGEAMVEDTPEGKVVNYAKASGLMLATAAMLNDKMSDIESKMAEALKAKRSK